MWVPPAGAAGDASAPADRQSVSHTPSSHATDQNITAAGVT